MNGLKRIGLGLLLGAVLGSMPFLHYACGAPHPQLPGSTTGDPHAAHGH